jgi:hypothetical protein
MATRKNRQNRKTKSGKKGGRKQRLIYQKGCSSSRRHLKGGTKCCSKHCSKHCECECHSNLKGGSNDTIAPLKMSGGCSGCMSQSGGGWSLPPVPAPLVDKSWTPQVSGWPGVDGVDGSRNYLANNLYDKFDPQTMMQLDSTQIGGSKKKAFKRRRSRRQCGGSLIPQQLTNLGRDLSFNFKSTYNAMNGYSAPVDPRPYMDQFRNTPKMV